MPLLLKPLRLELWKLWTMQSRISAREIADHQLEAFRIAEEAVAETVVAVVKQVRERLLKLQELVLEMALSKSSGMTSRTRSWMMQQYEFNLHGAESNRERKWRTQ